MKKITALLMFLVSSLAITGVSFIDGKIWDTVFVLIGMIAYTLVGVLFSIGILSTKQQGRDAYVLVFFLLIVGGFGIFKLLTIIRSWIISWPLVVKIVVPSAVGAMIIVSILFAIRYVIKNKKQITKKK